MSRLLFLRVGISVSMLCAALWAQAEDVPRDFASITPLAVTGQGPWYRLELPLALQLGAHQSNLADVRIFDANGQAQPYAVTRDQPQREEGQTPVTVKRFPLYNSDKAKDTEPKIRVQSTQNGSLVIVEPERERQAGEEVLRGWLLDTSTLDAPLNQLILDWGTQHEGFQRFSIEASDDLQHWTRWGEGQVARLSFADEVVEQRAVSLPGRKARYLRLLWNSTQSAPTLVSAQILVSNPGVVPLSWSPGIAGRVESPGVYVWELPVPLALERMKVQISQPNSLAPATLYTRRNSNAAWRLIDSGLLYRLSQDGQDLVQDEMELPGDVVQQLKLEVDGRGGSLGQDAPTLSLAARSTQLVFLGRGMPPYSLAIGNAAVHSTALPLTTLIPGLTPDKLATLGNAVLTQTPVFTKAPVIAPSPVVQIDSGPDWKRIGLWAVLVLGVLLLGAMAAGTMRTSKSDG